MKVSVTPTAMDWFQRDWGFKSGDYARIYVRYGGGHDGFSIAVGKSNAPEDVAAYTTQNGITFYIRDDDAWYFDEKNLTIDYLTREDDIVYDLQ